MIAADLSGVRLKLERAHECLHALDDDIDALVQGDSDATGILRGELDPHRGEWKLFCERTIQPRPEWSVQLGEFLYLLRSALDHLAWQLVVANGHDPIKGVTEFPIFKDRDAFQAMEARRVHKMTGMHEDVKTVIRAMQPYEEWPEHPAQTTLWRIHDFNNVDKHRLLILTEPLWWGVEVRIVSEGRPVPVICKYRTKRQTLEPDTLLGHYIWPPPDGETKFEWNGSYGIVIAEGDFVDDDGNPAVGMEVHRLTGVMFDNVNRTVLSKFGPFIPWTFLPCERGHRPPPATSKG